MNEKYTASFQCLKLISNYVRVFSPCKYKRSRNMKSHIFCQHIMFYINANQCPIYGRIDFLVVSLHAKCYRVHTAPHTACMHVHGCIYSNWKTSAIIMNCMKRTLLELLCSSWFSDIITLNAYISDALATHVCYYHESSVNAENTHPASSQ